MLFSALAFCTDIKYTILRCPTMSYHDTPPPQGMQHYSAVGVPLYITETGCPDPTDTVRPIMIATYMPQVVQAMEDPSIDLRGVMHWSLMDNWEYVFVCVGGCMIVSACGCVGVWVGVGGRELALQMSYVNLLVFHQSNTLLLYTLFYTLSNTLSNIPSHTSLLLH